MVVEEGLVGTLSVAFIFVAVIIEGTVEETGVVAAVGKILVVAPGRTVPGYVIGKVTRTAVVNAQAG